MEMLLLGAILVVVLALFITRWLPIETTALLIPPVLVLTGILDVPTALSGFSNPATITIAALFVISAGLMRTGALDAVAGALQRRARGSVTRLLVLMALTVPFVSAFMNNTPLVAMLMPAILAVSRQMNVRPSKLMIPLSYFAILGGTCTLIGTGTNVLVNEIYKTWQHQTGLPAHGFHMFEFAPMGLIMLTAGLLFILLVGRRILPERTTLSSILPPQRTAKFVTEIQIEANSNLLRRPVRDVFQAFPAVGLLELIRQEEVFLALQARDLTLEEDDALIIEGTSKAIAEFLTRTHVSLASVVEDDQRVPMRTMELMLAEGVVLPDSPFADRTVGDLALNKHYGVKVLAVQRGGFHLRKKIRHMVLRPGDVLLLQGGPKEYEALRESEAVLLVEGVEHAVRHHGRMGVAIAILLAVVGLAACTRIPIVILAVAGAALMIQLRCLRLEEAIRSLDIPVLALLAGSIPLGHAIASTGLAQAAVDQIMRVVSDSPPIVPLSVLYATTSLLTEFMSNQATAVLLAPIALQLAAHLGLDPRPFLMAVCYGASASFSTPIGYPTNLIVMGPGGYRFSDYARIGIFMNVLMWALATQFIPILWPLK